MAAPHMQAPPAGDISGEDDDHQDMPSDDDFSYGSLEAKLDNVRERLRSQRKEFVKAGGTRAKRYPGSRSHNTGPKGVKADYEEAKRNQRMQRLMQKLRTEKQLRERAEGESRFVLQEEQPEAPKQRKVRLEDDEEDDSSEISGLDSDSEEERRYRMSRMKNILLEAAPTFGTFNRWSYSQFGDILRKYKTVRTFIVCHLYANDIPDCVRINLAFEDLCTQFRHVCFGRVRIDEAVPGFEKAGLPALLIYQMGKCVLSPVAASLDIMDLAEGKTEGKSTQKTPRKQLPLSLRSAQVDLSMDSSTLTVNAPLLETVEGLDRLGVSKNSNVTKHDHDFSTKEVAAYLAYHGVLGSSIRPEDVLAEERRRQQKSQKLRAKPVKPDDN